MIGSQIRSVFVSLMCLNVVFSVPVTAVAKDDLFNIATTGILRNLETSNFRLNFTYRRGLVASLDDALHARYRQIEWSATGSLIKLDNYLSIRVDLDGLPEFDPATSTASRVSEQIFIGNMLQLNRVPRQRNQSNAEFGGYFQALLIGDVNLKMFDRVKHMGIVAPYSAPLAAFGISKIMDDGSPVSSVVHKAIDEHGAEKRVEFTLLGENDEVIESCTVDFARHFPELVETKGVNWHGWLEEYIALNETNRIATRLRFAVGPVRAIGHSEPCWILHDWQAGDVSVASLTDFVIQTNDDDTLFGLERPIGSTLDFIAIDSTHVLNRSNLPEPLDSNLPEPLDNNANKPSTNEITIYTNWYYYSGIAMVVLVILGAAIIFSRRFHVVAIVFLLSTLGCETNSVVDTNYMKTKFDETLPEIPTDGRETIAVCDVGTIIYRPQEHAEPYRVTLKFQNKFNSPRYYAIIGTSCVCVAANVSQQLQPGEEGEISVQIHLDRITGPFLLSLAIREHTSNSEEPTYYVAKILGRVFPAFVINGFNSQPITVKKGGPVTLECTAYSTAPIPPLLDILTDKESFEVTHHQIDRVTDGFYFRNRWRIVVRLIKNEVSNSIIQFCCNEQNISLLFSSIQPTALVSPASLFFREASGKLQDVLLDLPPNETVTNIEYDATKLVIIDKLVDQNTIRVGIKSGVEESYHGTVLIYGIDPEIPIAKFTVSYLE
ncbi:MAG: DUF1573 domain-containing protein [Pirellulaceae bacterium]|nr:DUF1573 domain-containing protein [Pirellulaceae bacterium]